MTRRDKSNNWILVETDSLSSDNPNTYPGHTLKIERHPKRTDTVFTITKPERGGRERRVEIAIGTGALRAHLRWLDQQIAKARKQLKKEKRKQ